MARGPKVMPTSPVSGIGVAIVVAAVGFVIAGEQGWIGPWLGEWILYGVAITMATSFVWVLGYVYAAMPSDWRLPYWLVVALAGAATVRSFLL